ncbi:Tol-Pal system beta propeller repeat protein TolB [Rugamonas sp.]|uniref:Tol-Pal system beta propeller repeat protein TolB n=1 Tax=Rugamonas sp. TaxID=1926287 RepID=UPI0025CDB12C|nr:Tol-Pal system beta propeller repeat protein TolB [Rugamonas sp.]
MKKPSSALRLALSRTLIAAGLSAGVAATAHAQIHIEVSGVGNNQIPIAIATFADENLAPQHISAIIKADLERSGAFQIMDAGTISDTADVDYSAWKSRGAAAVVVGSVQQLANGSFAVRYKLLDTVKQAKISQLDVMTAPQYPRVSAHKIADDIYLKLTGVRGAFDTRIAYVTEENRKFKLKVADADGENIQEALASPEPIISPSWSPDGTKVAYVSFEQRKSVVYVQNLITRARVVVANEKGSNSAPSWSPDGSKLAVALSKDGHTQVYVVGADGGGLHRVSNSAGIDTEPQWSADGQNIYFTSDRSGGPQIYRMSANGGDAQRVTFSGSYNISPRIASDGKTLAYISRRDGNFQLYVLDLASSQETRLSDTNNDQSPSFSPNGKYIMYATQAGQRKSLAVVSVDGRVKQRLTAQAGNIKEPTWGPFMQ